MHPIVRNILAVILGFILGSMVNMALIQLSGIIIPPPEGTDVSNMESLKATMHLFESKHFLFPFLAHALGTLVAAFVVTKLAVTHIKKLVLLIGMLFLFAGIINIILLPSPLWFTIVDLLAYIPMAYLGWVLGGKRE
ncbi:hypothetical protein [Flavobacterium orientale]|uniref:Uncharacterized protein n=1 Tax=Flavobacterium orientale TaxID=1756020 RepID=A0A916Y8I6_9FLAO|nr:hypothetical protein [Flavobacterium orientale]GGD34732.1 hypothetical protein GCM10011343_25760 [Flavobacterium orientale]